MPESVFISYAHEDADLARFFASELVRAGYRVWIDEGELLIGDSLIERIATGIRGAQFVLALVSPASVNSNWCRRELSMAISGELRALGVRVLPLRVAGVDMPPTLEGVRYQSVDPETPGAAVGPIIAAIRGHHTDREEARLHTTSEANETADLSALIRIEGVIVEEVGAPRNDGAPGSGLYVVPLRLSRTPNADWADDFVAAWDSPPRWTTRHRPGIASVTADRIVLDGTTIEEVERVHLPTLRLALEIANGREAERRMTAESEARRQREAADAHETLVRTTAERLSFESDPRDRLSPDAPLIYVSDLRVDPIDPETLEPSPLPPPPNELVLTIMNCGNGPAYQIHGFGHFRQSGGAWQPLGSFSVIDALPVGVTVERRFRPPAGMPWPSYVTPDRARIEGACLDGRDREHRFGG
jgi:hypothetical protein